MIHRKRRTSPSRIHYPRIFLLTMAIAFIGTTTIMLARMVLSSSPKPTPATPKVVSNVNGSLVYNIQKPPKLVYSEDLQKIVDETLKLAADKQFPTDDSISITLIDVSDPKTHTYAGYNNTMLRFPASVSKLFWLVAFLGYSEAGLIKDESAYYVDLSNMMRISDNDSASRIVDSISGTKSGKELEGKALETWINKRHQVNIFFREAGYTGIKLSVKNYPLSDGSQQPTGRDFQLWKDSSLAGGNRISTDQAARLMYEIYTKRAISETASTKIAYLLTRDLNPEAWKDEQPNSIEGFLGESLPTDIYFGSKVGYTSHSRQEVAFVRTMDDKAIYILAIFANHSAYAEDEDIFPEMSRYIFDRLNGSPPPSTSNKKHSATRKQ
ncbi:serine hydrolase [Capilliphycus salinus ALCB114379]|uniref:serine hydrolase n=1 Tax=Capilliphycus salinus TaxID=2768948 RepID=UPI0039A46279